MGYISEGSTDINQQRELIIQKLNSAEIDDYKISTDTKNACEEDEEDEEVNIKKDP